jgi:hypothetical protein
MESSCLEFEFRSGSARPRQQPDAPEYFARLGAWLTALGLTH